MVKARQTIALAGVGDLGRYVCEELLESSQFDIVVLTREVSEHIKLSYLIIQPFLMSDILSN